jgi:6,7-dimethyl-8-ribityllumazine synthase
MADKDGAPTPPRFDAPPRLLIVAAPFYRDIADHLLAGARAVLDGFSAPHETVEVPGALEIGAAIGFAAAGPATRFDGFVALGCVIRGETTHYDLVCEESARAITWLGLERGLCVGNGVLTCETRAQALARADRNVMDKGGGAALAALHLIALKRRFADAP